MEGVRYFVPTRGRVDRQITLRGVPESVHHLFTLVCPAEEVDRLRLLWPGVQVLAQPEEVTTIGRKRKWIFDEAAKDVEMAWQFDDDLRFRVFAEGAHRSVEKYPAETEAAWRLLPRLAYHVQGIGTSFFAPKGGVKENYHLGFAFGFSRHARSKLLMDRMNVFEDIDYTLQMLRAGVRIGVTYDLVVDQVQADAPGGVEGQRDRISILGALEQLMEHHPGLVAEKPLRPGAHPAAIVRVSWAKAAKEGGM